jgi:hypothetical protein
MRLLVTILFLLISLSIQSQTDTSHIIKVHFLYGSKPLKKYKATEAKYFGGIHGGHVTIESDSIDYGFSPVGRVHMISHRGNTHSVFHGKETHNQAPYPKGYKVCTFIIPITEIQYRELQKINSTRCNKPPYDYAFLGMRCAASAQDVLGQIGIVKKRGRLKNIFSTFYPKKLRRRMFKLAKEKNYKIETQEGRVTRKWEKD